MKKGYIISSQAVKLISCFLTLVLLFSLVLSVNSTAEASQETDTTIETGANDLDTYPDEYDELDIPEEIRKELDKHGISLKKEMMMSLAPLIRNLRKCLLLRYPQ